MPCVYTVVPSSWLLPLMLLFLLLFLLPLSLLLLLLVLITVMRCPVPPLATTPPRQVGAQGYQRSSRVTGWGTPRGWLARLLRCG